MELTEILEKSGLSEKEAKVYLALLELGSGSIADIAKKAGIKRPTCYLVVEDLKHRGLVSSVPSRVNIFTAEGPEKLSGDLFKKQELLKRFLPSLQALHNSKKEKPQVQLFEGTEGVKQVYEMIYASNEVWFFGTPEEVLKIAPESLWEFVKKVKTLNLKVRDLMAETPRHLEYAKKAGAAQNYEIRFLPNGFSFLSDSALFGNTVVFFSFKPTVFAVSITSKEISQALKVLYELSWSQSKTSV